MEVPLILGMGKGQAVLPSVYHQGSQLEGSGHSEPAVVRGAEGSFVCLPSSRLDLQPTSGIPVVQGLHPWPQFSHPLPSLSPARRSSYPGSWAAWSLHLPHS